jgi:hypothetical protein
MEYRNCDAAEKSGGKDWANNNKCPQARLSMDYQIVTRT